jgi:hypothetical protein
MEGDDTSEEDDGLAIEPEFDSNAGGDGQWHHQLDVTAAAAEIGGFEAQRDVAACQMDFGLDVNGLARIAAAIVFDRGGCRRLSAEEIYRLSPGSAAFGPRMIPVVIIGIEVGRV